jgi:hypothetical protein
MAEAYDMRRQLSETPSEYQLRELAFEDRAPEGAKPKSKREEKRLAEAQQREGTGVADDRRPGLTPATDD